MGGDKPRGRGGVKRPPRGAVSSRPERKPHSSKFSDEREEMSYSHKPRGSIRGSQRGSFGRGGFSKPKGRKRLEDEDEETTISRQLRKLLREEKPDSFNTQMAVLNDLLVLPDNLHYIQRCAHFLLDSLYDLLSCAPNSACKVQAVHAMAFINHLLLPDDDRFVKLAVDGLRDSQDTPSSSAVKVLLLMAMRKAISLDKNKRSSLLWCSDTVECVCGVLEGTEELPLMVAAVEVLRLLYRVRPQQLADAFEDVVDILIGWHIETDQPPAVREYVRETLTSWPELWRQHTALVSTLLSQFLDDMKEYLLELEASEADDYVPGPDAEKPDACAEKVQLFLSVFECVLACCTAGEDTEQTGLEVGFLVSCLDSVLAAARTLLCCCHPPALFATLNQLMQHCLQLAGSPTELETQLLQLLQLQRSRLLAAAHASQLAYLDLLVKVLESDGSSLGAAIVAEMFCPESPLRQLRVSREGTVWRAALKVHHAATALKNIPLLQDVYQYILSDLTWCHSVLIRRSLCLSNGATTAPALRPEAGAPYSDSQAAPIFTFLITALVQLSKVRNSMICMWALDPTLLQLFAVRLTASDACLASDHPSAHLALVRTLHAHCKAHHNFVGSSSLLGTRAPTDAFSSFTPASSSVPTFSSFVPASATSSIASFVPAQPQSYVQPSLPSFTIGDTQSSSSSFTSLTINSKSSVRVTELVTEPQEKQVTVDERQAHSPPSSVKSTDLPKESPTFGATSTSQNLTIIIRTVEELLTLGGRCSPEVLQLSVQWCSDICNDIARSSCNAAATSAAVQPLLQALVRLVSVDASLPSELIISAADAMASAVRLFVLPEASTCLNEVVQLCSAMLCHNSAEIVSAYFTVYAALPIAVVAAHHDSSRGSQINSQKKRSGKFKSLLESIKLLQKHYQLSVNCWNELSSVNFHQLAKFLLDTSENPYNSKGDWLELIAMMAHQIHSMPNTPDLNGRGKNLDKKRALESPVKIDNTGDTVLDSHHGLGQQVARAEEQILSKNHENYNLQESLVGADKLESSSVVDDENGEPTVDSDKSNKSSLVPEPKSVEGLNSKESSGEAETSVNGNPEENKELSTGPNGTRDSPSVCCDKPKESSTFKGTPKTSPDTGDVVDMKMLGDLCRSNKRFLWQWLLWLFAQHCVANKLKTSLGKPQDLFVLIEAAMRHWQQESISSNCHHSRPSDAETSYGSATSSDLGRGFSDKTHDRKMLLDRTSDAGTEDAYQTAESGTSGSSGKDELPRSLLLVELVSFLEKSLLFARSGSVAYTLPASKVIRTFFCTSRDACNEGLSSLRFPAAVTALDVGMPHEALWHASALLKSLPRDAENDDVTRVVVLCVRALIALGCPEGVLGVLRYCAERHPHTDLSWLNAAACAADNRHEAALACLYQYLAQEPVHRPVLGHHRTLTESLSPAPFILFWAKHNLHSCLVYNSAEQSLKEFISEQIGECYSRLTSYDLLIEWESELMRTEESLDANGRDARHLQTGDYRNSSTYAEALSKFDSGNLIGMHEALSDDYPHTKDGGILLSSIRQDERSRQLSHLQLGTLRCAVQLLPNCGGSQELGVELEELEKRAQNLLQLISCGAQAPALQLQLTATIQLIHQVRGCYSGDPPPATFYAELPEARSLRRLPSDLLPTLLRHLRLLTPVNPHIRESFIIPLMEVACMKQARLQRNYSTCLRSVMRALQPGHPSAWCDQYSHELLDHCLQATTAAALSSHYYPYLVSLIREGTKLMRQAGSDLQLSSSSYIDASFNTLATLVHTCSAELFGSPKPDCEMSLSVARSVLNIASWIESDVPASEDVAVSRSWGGALHSMCMRGELYMSPPLSELANAATRSGASPRDELVVRCLSTASLLKPDLAKAWYRLANWCYRFGCKAVDRVLTSQVPVLSVEDMTGIEDLLTSRLGTMPSPGLVGLVCEAVSWLPSPDELKSSLETEDLCDLRLEETRASDQLVEDKVAACLGAHLLSAGPEREALIGDLRSLRTTAFLRHYHLLSIAAHSYFEFFRNASVNGRKHEAPLMTAALRLVRLLVKHAPQLKQVLLQGFVESPTAPWTSIIPQLFARLNHSEGWVRQSISSLLCRVAQHQPHLIVVPAVVGANTHSVTTNMTDMLVDFLHGGDKNDGADTKAQGLLVDDDLALLDDGDADEFEDSDGLETRQMLLNSCSCLVTELRKVGIPGISDAEVLVRELRRITVLWDELWLGSLQQHQTDIANKFAQLSEETDKLNSNHSLSADEKQQLIRTKFEVIFKPVLLLLEQLWQFTGRTAETPHERQFQQRYGGLIRDALSALRDNVSSGAPRTACALLHRLYQALQDRRSSRANSSLQMAAISPALSRLSATNIPMPGIVTHNSQMVHLHSIDENVTILLSKTKPKKLCFRGDDGNTYRYLFKGLEDLHLDERIMQFLEMVNRLLGARDSSGFYQAQHYSVVPLGQRSGLIQWVESAVPLYGLYGRHQQREAQTVALRTGAPLQPVRRPSELYYQKLTPRLKAAGVSVNNRKLWPKELLKAIMLELVEETPSDLLSRELIASSPTTADWWSVTHRYGVCTAVMSMVGLVLGLGDRHLDNLLVNFSTGEVVHIDYNVCFEKGKLLRVPEHVPYRMTQNIEAALGVTGVEGVFRHACEHVMATMREGRESLLTLLETFIYDPLVDWTHDADAGYAGAMYGGNAALASSVRQRRRQVERTLTLTMFRVRSKEIAASWQANRDAVCSQLKEVCGALRALLTLQGHEASEDLEEDLTTPVTSSLDNDVPASPEEAAAMASITEQVQRLKQLFSVHHRIISDVKDLLRSLMKLKDNIGETVRSFIARYRTFAENVTSFIKEVLSGGLRKQTSYLTCLAENSLSVTSVLYNELLSLVEEESSDRALQEKESSKSEAPSRKNSTASPVEAVSHVVSDSSTQKAAQDSSEKKVVQIISNTGSGVQHNPYAVAVWRRVSLKLEGRTAGQTDTSRVLTVAEQVDESIQAAKSLDNLSVMYEGWTAWV